MKKVIALGLLIFLAACAAPPEEIDPTLPTTTIEMDVLNFTFEPDVIEVPQGNRVVLNINKVTSVDPVVFTRHTFTIGAPYNIHEVLEVGNTYQIEFVASEPGEFKFECAIFCGEDHHSMNGKLIVHAADESEVIEKLDYMDINTIQDSIQVMVDETTLPDGPQSWAIEDFPYLMSVIQTDYPNGAIKVINTNTLEDLGDIEDVGQNVHVLELHPNERWIYTIARDGLVSKIDLYTLQILRTVRIGDDSRGIAISEDGKYIATGNYHPNSAVILDAETLEPLKIIEASGVDPDGEFVESLVANVFGLDKQKMFAINLKGAGQTWFIQQEPPFDVVEKFTTGRVLHEINALDEEEDFIAITSQVDSKYTIIDTNNLEIVSEIPSSRTPHPGQGTLDIKNNLWIGNSINSANLTVINTQTHEIEGFIWPDGVDLYAGGGLFTSPIPTERQDLPYFIADIIFGDEGGTLYIVDRQMLADGKFGSEPVVATINWEDFGFDEPGRIIHPEYSYKGKYVVFGGWDFDKIIVIDAEALPEVKVVKMFDATTPTGVFPTWRFDAMYLG